ncbi:MAG: 5-(carboxyamino)imidazole ribonucleotide mutase [Planctomycetes bacterium]|nr:5-(carboxyamino)imidazole ribonucleotide mutase [Planctomycetota bacterium]
MSECRVAVIMGSDSDWNVMQSCVEQLKAFGLTAEVRVLSAHRTPGDVVEFVQSAAEQGIEVFIAAAGMSAALAGIVAAHTNRPVIGVPVDSGGLGGLDALLSTVQMPPGVPVAGMAIGKPGARNAAILAAQILALKDDSVASALTAFKTKQAEEVRRKDRDLRQGPASAS